MNTLENPILETPIFPHSAINFEKIKPEHFLPALEKVIAEAKSKLEKIKSASQFQTGYANLRQIRFATLDMAYHTTPAEQICDVLEFEDKITAPMQVLPKISGANSSVSFQHIFAGGYSAGYYSYKWAEVLDADAFEFFKQSGIFNTHTAKLFKENILERGGTEHPMVLYKSFRGREPDTKALLRRDGLL